jgi:hypothetical protein
MADGTVDATGKPVGPAAPDPTLKQKLLEAYKRMLSYQFFGTLALIMLLGTGLIVAVSHEQLQHYTLIAVTLSGMLGAFFSALTRLYNVEQLPAALMSETVLGLNRFHLMMYSFVPPIVGAIGSVVLYVGFTSGLIDGGVFPKMVCKVGDNKCTDFGLLLTQYGPKDATDYGKALIWGFIAGFSERLVPDMLQAIVAKTANDEAK